MKNTLLLLTFLCTCVLAQIHAQPVLVFENAVSGFDSPVDLTGAGDGSNRLFIVELPGRIRVYDQTTGQTLAGNFLDISARVRSGGERGLLGLAFHPEFATNGHFFVNYTTEARNGLAAGTTVIARYTVPTDGMTAIEDTETVMLTVNQIASNHNAGDLAFGPDGYLYIPLGDGGGGGDPQDVAQNNRSLLGKMLRIDVDNPSGGNNYGIPVDNPFQIVGDTIPDEIYATGLRNPWRISFDRQTGDLWIADVGQGAREEVNFQAAGTPGGQNYGWDCREGTIAYGGASVRCDDPLTLTEPVFDYDHSPDNGGFSITGGFVYRGSASDLKGYYVAIDFATNRLFVYDRATNTLLRQASGLGGVASFGEDDDGELYAVELGGTFYRVTTQQALPVALSDWTATPRGKTVDLAWATTSENAAADFRLERSIDGSDFVPLATVPARGNSSQGADYSFTDADPLPGRSYYRLVQRDFDGHMRTYGIRPVLLAGGNETEPVLSPNPTTGTFALEIPEVKTSGKVEVRVYSPEGRQVFDEEQTVAAGAVRTLCRLPKLPPAVYQVLISFGGQSYARKLEVR